MKVHSKNLHAQTKFIKPLQFFFSRLFSFGFDWQDKTRPSTCNARWAILTLHLKHKRRKNTLP